ncbi:MAG: hypothetical protein FJX80_06340 [Bacteroidetes bacterium]|nr:hypothetical protein [Bacteroidota bacterium]
MSDIRKRIFDLTKGDFEKAFKAYANMKDFYPKSHYYDIEWRGNVYPPKAIIAIAYKIRYNEEIKTTEFKEGIKSKEFRLIETLGFSIIPKKEERIIIFNIQESSAQNTKVLLSSSKKHFYWNDEQFKILNVGDYVFIVNVFSKNVIFSRLHDKEVRTDLNQEICCAVFTRQEQEFKAKAASLEQLNKWNNFVELEVLDIFSTGESWKWKTLGSGQKTFILGPDVSLDSLKNNLDRIEQLKEVSDNERYTEVLKRCETFLLAKLKFGKQADLEELASNNLINSFTNAASQQNLIFSSFLTKRYIASLATKPFVIFTGLSGSGKTKLAQTFAKWICENDNQYQIVPVGADWTNREPLLGYPNSLEPSKYVLPDNGALNLILTAIDNARDKELKDCKPYFLILDEMNLSHVERYFADFLSGMESKEAISLYSGNKRKDENGRTIPNEITLPPNLFLVGTVNIDETTYMFSPKVLDRANTIEFRVDKEDIIRFFDAPVDNSGELIDAKGSTYSGDLMAFVSEQTEQSDTYQKQLLEFFKALQPIGAEFGYRTANEINRLIPLLELLGMEKTESALDVAVMQKLLPKLHGSRTKLNKVLPVLASFCFKSCNTDQAKLFLDEFKQEGKLKSETKPILPLSFTKIARMYAAAQENGFASYAEG